MILQFGFGSLGSGFLGFMIFGNSANLIFSHSQLHTQFSIFYSQLISSLFKKLNDLVRRRFVVGSILRHGKLLMWPTAFAHGSGLKNGSVFKNRDPNCP